MKKSASFLLLLAICSISFGQSHDKKDTDQEGTKPKCSIKDYQGKDYWFTVPRLLKPCSDLGVLTSGAEVKVEPGYTFNVYNVDDQTCDVIIKFDDFKQKFTDKVTSFNGKYFRLSKAELEKASDFEEHKTYFTGQFGTLVTPFKFRPSKSFWTNNFSLGASINFIHQTGWKDISWGFVGGFSLTSVTLDSYSTNNVVTKDSDRPAYTPSLSLIGAYKNINIMIGTGWDYINRKTAEDHSWVFQGKQWLGFGIGISLFTPSSEKSPSKKSDEQKN